MLAAQSTATYTPPRPRPPPAPPNSPAPIEALPAAGFTGGDVIEATWDRAPARFHPRPAA